MKASLNSKQVKDGLRTGKRYTHNGLSIVCIKKNSSKKRKYAILIPKRTVRNSTARNRIKRVIRETVKTVDIKCCEFIVIHTNKSRDEVGVCEDLVYAANKIR